MCGTISPGKYLIPINMVTDPRYQPTKRPPNAGELPNERCREFWTGLWNVSHDSLLGPEIRPGNQIKVHCGACRLLNYVASGGLKIFADP